MNGWGEHRGRGGVAVSAAVRGLFGVVLLLPAAPARGSSSEGTSAVSVLKLNLGARPAGLGGAYSAVAEGPEAALYNPAGLTQQPYPELNATHHEMYRGLSLEQVAAVYPLRPNHAFGAHLLAFDSGRIDRTSEDASGSYDASGSGGSYSVKDRVLAVSYAFAPSRRLSLGLSAKHVQDTVAGEGAGAWAADFGALARLGPLRLGASALNLGERLEGFSLPASIRLGLAVELVAFGVPLLAAAEGIEPLDGGAFRKGLGLEAQVLGPVRLSAGYRAGVGSDKVQSGFAFGLGLAWRGFEAGFSFAPYGELGSIGTFALSYRFLPKAPER